MKVDQNCLIFDKGAYNMGEKPMTPRIKEFCGKASLSFNVQQFMVFKT